MAYTDRAGLILAGVTDATLIELTDEEGDLSQVNARITQAIVDADAEIDTWIASLYTVPLTSPGDDPRIKKWSGNIAIFNLHQRSPVGVPEDIEKTYKRTIKFLEKVQSSKIKLNIDVQKSDFNFSSTTSESPHRRTFP